MTTVVWSRRVTEWLLFLPPAPFLSCLATSSACALWVTLMSLPTLAKQNLAGPWLFLFWDLQIWGLVALCASECRSSNFTVVLPPYIFICPTSDVFPISNTWMITFSWSFFSSSAYSSLTLFIRGDKALSVKNCPYNRAWRLLFWRLLCSVRAPSPTVFLPARIIYLLKWWWSQRNWRFVSNTFSVEFCHTVLLSGSEIGHITSSVESENASYWSLKLLTIMKKSFY